MFAVTGFDDLDTGRGIAYSAELVHPELGVVGRIANEGCGGPTTFYSDNRARFGEDHLELFLGQCRQDGEPMDIGHFGVETLLDAIIDEAETVETVAEMRRKGQFLVRSYLPREAAPWGPHRGAPWPIPGSCCAATPGSAWPRGWPACRLSGSRTAPTGRCSTVPSGHACWVSLR
jgi:hypothetical protein